MVSLVSARSGFEAKVLTARLGAEGIIWQVRGGLLDAVYPVGQVEILVAADDIERARELLVVDELEAVFEEVALDARGDESPEGARSRSGHSTVEWWLMAGLVVVVGVLVLARVFFLR